MALKNHALDEGILSAAREEFLEKGYEAASLRHIAAQADVTVGAIYTRYPTKDALFCALVEPLIRRIGETFREIRSSYYDAKPEHIADSMNMESEAILHLLFDDYDRSASALPQHGQQPGGLCRQPGGAEDPGNPGVFPGGRGAASRGAGAAAAGQRTASYVL